MSLRAEKDGFVAHPLITPCPSNSQCHHLVLLSNWCMLASHLVHRFYIPASTYFLSCATGVCFQSDKDTRLLGVHQKINKTYWCVLP